MRFKKNKNEGKRNGHSDRDWRPRQILELSTDQYSNAIHPNSFVKNQNKKLQKLIQIIPSRLTQSVIAHWSLLPYRNENLGSCILLLKNTIYSDSLGSSASFLTIIPNHRMKRHTPYMKSYLIFIRY